MKRLIRNICIGILALLVLSFLLALVIALISMWTWGMWYVVVALIVGILALIGVASLGDA
ncbi:hypothetical protein LCGC14_2500410 [marine sediment metagenome]|uniref:Uncharacterized protein n=1 Tax=marine sediment metagenome TaxID=412755 RepID=A0A0F9DDV0_9ZZZZ